MNTVEHPFSTTLEYTCVPLAVRAAGGGLWYPRVRWELNGQFSSETEYVLGLETEAAALAFARTFAREEMEARQRSIDHFLETRKGLFP